MSTKIERLTEELKAHLKAAQAIAAAAEKDGDRDLTDAERGQVQEHFAKAKAAKDALSAAKADEQTKAAIRELGDGIGLDESGSATERGEKAARSGLIVPDQRKSIGEYFTESRQYADLLATAPNGQFAKDMRVQSYPVGFKSLVTGASDTSAGALVESDRRGLLVGPELFYRPLTLRSLVTLGTTTSDQIEYARVTGFTNNAAPVAEATTSAGPTANTTTGALENPAGGGYKPESGFSTVRVTTPVRTIAHWMPATKRALSDAAQVRTLIDNFLEVGLEEELEDQMISGDNTGENFEGLATVSGTQTQTLVADPAGKPAGFGKLLTLRRAKTKVRTVGRAIPNAYVINPGDLESLDEISDNDGRFYFGGPSGSNGTAPLWGLPVIESEAVPAGTAWVGDWRKAILWDREQASVTITDSHADFFVRNLVAILAEMRAAFGVIQPSAFVKVALA
ncbi:phage major capsid protein [Pseudonocardia hispaniensis]|uniref:Phage major capsid protein n=1 Tax=Pseudonocardia hispaniensis TaxID=904933 RepID=A0ABW1IWS4_9PSEU